jgi:hypothetical protein
MRRLRQFFLLLAAAGLWLPVGALGQQPSHLDELNEPLPKDFTRLLDVRRGKRTTSNDEFLRQLLQNMPNVDPKNFDQEKIRNLLNNKEIQKLLNDNPNLKDPDNLQRMLQDLKDPDNLQRMLQDSRVNPKDSQWRNLEKVLKDLGKLPDIPKLDRKGKPIKPPSEPPADRPDHPRNQPSPAPKNDGQLDEISRWALKQFGDSPTTRNMVNDFVKLMGEGDLGSDATGLLKDAAQEWKSFFGSTNDPSSSGKLGDLASGLRLPDVSPSGSDRSGLRGPSIGGDAGRSSGGSWGDDPWTGLLLAALVALIGFFYWHRFIRSRPAKDVDEAHQRLAWPVEPHAVATREDVVKAFDFLSLAKCGDEAVNWHHRQIARQLSDKEPDKDEAVVRLTGLYEKARYAPASDLFSDTEIAEARARLCQIAGAPTA